jgi:colicin import membrane protein
MKKYLLLFILSFGLFLSGSAQTSGTPSSTTTTTKTKIGKKSSGTTKEGKPDMRLKANRDAAKESQTVATTKPATTAPVTIKPKTRKSHKKDVADVQPVTPVTPATVQPDTRPQPAQVVTTKPTMHKTTTHKKTVVQGANTSSNQAVGADAKGRTLYRGKRGGTYYINKNGNKEYVKQQ